MSDFHFKCTKFNFGWDSASDPARGAPQIDHLARFGKKEGNEKGGEKEERKEQGWGGARKEGEARGGREREREKVRICSIKQRR